jgi:hypothetical protein
MGCRVGVTFFVIRGRVVYDSVAATGELARGAAAIGEVGVVGAIVTLLAVGSCIIADGITAEREYACGGAAAIGEVGVAGAIVTLLVIGRGVVGDGIAAERE